MTVTVNKESAKQLSELLKRKLKNKTKKGSLTKHFGKLKRNIDGLEYQKELRQNED